VHENFDKQDGDLQMRLYLRQEKALIELSFRIKNFPISMMKSMQTMGQI
jgi:hypothetical protein